MGMSSVSPHQHALSTAIRSLAASRSPGCILDTAGAFLFVNEAWERLPPDAGGPPPCGTPLVGTPFAARLPDGPLRGACAAAVADVLASRGPAPRVLAGEWNDAATARLVSTRIAPLVAGDGVIGVVLSRSIVRERPVEEVYEVGDRGDAAYRDAAGALVRCPCCRRVRDVADPERWDFVPRLASDPAASSALCELCAELHVPAL
jgi:hypothetical protein